MKQPSKSVAGLLDVRKSLQKLGDDFWAKEKLAEVDGLIAACLGLHLEAVSEKLAAQPGETLALQIEAINRSARAGEMEEPASAREWRGHRRRRRVTQGELITKKASVKLPATLPFSQPYWLREPGTPGTFAVADQALIGRPENPPAFPVELTFEIGGEEIAYQVEPRFRKVDRVEGETNQPLVIAPPVFVELPRPVFVFANTAPKTLNVRVVSQVENAMGSVALEAPAGWKVEPASAPIELHGAESEMTCVFQITPPARAGEGTLRAVFIQRIR